MYLLGESLNVISTKIGRAFEERDPKPIQKEALEQKELGMDYIDINIGSAKKNGHELMPWVVEVVQDVVPDLPLVLDTSNIDAIETALKVYKETENPVIINSITACPKKYEKMIPLAVEYNADFVALMWGPDGLPKDENERAALAVELFKAANEAGIENERIWVDGIVTPINEQPSQFIGLLNFHAMIKDIASGVKSTCGLSNISKGFPEHLRSILNSTFMVMLEYYEMYSVISDPSDKGLTAIAKGEREDIVDLIYAMIEGYDPDIASLSDELQNYAKTYKVIMSETSFSNSWLEI